MRDSNIPLVSSNEIGRISTRNRRSIGHDLVFLTDLYESGMHHILREVAMKMIAENKVLPACINNTAIRQAADEPSEVYNAMYDMLTTEQQRDQLSELEAAYNEVAAVECEEFFIAGFIQGYQFLKIVTGQQRNYVMQDEKSPL